MSDRLTWEARAMGRFTDKVAIVTGAGSGIGRATSLRLASEGASVACFDIVEENVQKTVAQVGEEGGRAAPFVVDVSNEDSVRASVAAAVDELGPPNVLCNI